MANAKYQPTIKEARTAYWEAVTEYEETRTDALSTYWQLKSAASRVAVAREEWFRAVARSGNRGTPYAMRLAAAKVNVCKETGEPLEFFKKRS